MTAPGWHAFPLGRGRGLSPVFRGCGRGVWSPSTMPATTGNSLQAPRSRATAAPPTRRRGVRHGRRRVAAVASRWGCVFALFVLALAPRLVLANGPGSAGGSGSVGTRGASGSGSARGDEDGKKFQMPDMVYGGNAISFVAPMQFGLVGYVPRVRLGLQYDYQLYKGQWLFAGAAALLDNGDHRTFKTGCGLSGQTGRCGNGTVAGFDVYGGYAYKFYIREHPWLVPIARGSLGFMWWKYPDIGGSRQQARIRSFAFNLRPGGGLRIFLLSDLAIGFDLNFQIGVYGHKDQDIGEQTEGSAQFQLGLEVLPLIVEYRF